MMKKSTLMKSTAILLLALALSGCGKKESDKPAQTDSAETTMEKIEKDTNSSEEETLSEEDMDLVKYNYYVELNNDLAEILQSIGYYFQVVGDSEEFSLLPDTGLTYGYRIYGHNSDIVDDCLMLADMEPDYGELDALVKEMAEPLKNLMDTFSNISSSHDYAANQYQKAKDYHAVVYSTAGTVSTLGPQYMEALSEMGNARTAEEEEKMKAEERFIIYNASRGISIGKQVLDEIQRQGITDETITQLDLTKIRSLHDELVAVVADFEAATADNNQLIKESLSNSRPFDGLYDSLIQALEWMIKQVESGRPLDLSGSGAPLGSIGHFSETLSKCVDRYNTVFVD
ncbi:DUF3829 domain-containing protein [Lachnospiraceae bacterium 62-35]